MNRHRQRMSEQRPSCVDLTVTDPWFTERWYLRRGEPLGVPVADLPPLTAIESSAETPGRMITDRASDGIPPASGRVRKLGTGTFDVPAAGHAAGQLASKARVARLGSFLG